MHASAVFAAALLGLSNAQFSHFYTRPGQKAVTLDILVNKEPAALAEGYFFVTPYETDFQPDGGKYGPHIFDSAGHLIYCGNDTVLHRGMDAHVCEYAGHANGVLCYTDADPVEQGGHSSGVNRFFDNTYKQIGPNYAGFNGLRGPDIHELNVPVGQGGTTFIQDIYRLVQKDLTQYDGPKDGYVLSGCFQEVSFAEDKAIFQWCSTDHVPIYETYVYLPGNKAGNYSDSISGHGTRNEPWDYFHINAIGKDSEGNYIVSSRQFHTLFKIAGAKAQNPGSIIWHLGGKRNDFKLNGFNFSWQHDARWHQNAFSSGVGITLFDNAYDGTPQSQSAQASSGVFIDVDEAGRSASLRGQYVQPGGMLSVSQGSVLPMPNGNVVVGWGSIPYFSEHASDGTTLFYAEFAKGSPNPLQSYRVYKQKWIGQPAEAPLILPYSETCHSHNKYIYASNNGATEIASWRVFTGNSSSGPWTTRGTFKKFTFETTMQISTTNFQKWAYVESLDSSGNVLRKSAPTKFFVPKTSVKGCGQQSCGHSVKYNAANSMAGSC